MSTESSEALAALAAIKTMSITERRHKVSVRDFPQVPERLDLMAFETLLPKLLRSAELCAVADRFALAVQNQRGNIIAMGGHVVECGLGPLLFAGDDKIGSKFRLFMLSR